MNKGPFVANLRVPIAQALRGLGRQPIWQTIGGRLSPAETPPRAANVATKSGGWAWTVQKEVNND
jgi:hypothetical protein